LKTSNDAPDLFLLAVESGDRPDHELVEQRNRESHVSMRWAVDHPFLDELGPNGPEACDFDSQLIRNVARALSARPEFGHRAPEVLPAWGQAIKANAKLS